MTERTTFFDTPLSQLKGLGPQRTELLNLELNLFTYGDLIQYYPFRYDDRTRYYTISELMDSMPSAQVRGRLRDWCMEGEGPKKRLVAQFTDGTGSMSLVWFQGVSYIEKILRREGEYIAYGKPQSFNGQFSIIHPELENAATASDSEPAFFRSITSPTNYVSATSTAKPLAKSCGFCWSSRGPTFTRPCPMRSCSNTAGGQAGSHVEHSPAAEPGVAEAGRASAKV
jgi:RecG-like helicase